MSKIKGGGIGAALVRGSSGVTPGATSRRSKPMRTTLDLKPEAWQDAQRWIGEAQMRSQTRVQLAPVLRALLAELTDADAVTGEPTPAARELSDRIMERMREQ